MGMRDPRDTHDASPVAYADTQAAPPDRPGAPSPERFRRIEEVFDAAADAAPEDRDALLDRLCDGDPDLRAEVASLLAASAGANDRIAAAVGGEAARVAGAATPRRLGPYRLEREIGHGGMGAVYLAVRDDDEYRTKVAIKLLHHGLETAQAVARFRDERQILATLEHPGIVRLLDGGSTEERLPYLVMEHVEGAPITAWADRRGLDVRGRVELFRKVCAAVAFAHQKLVVHRDIKPSNVLVTDAGEPKLLDFGIAKLLDPGAGREAATRTGMRLLTPEYASPEQVRGEPVSTAADVYALGAVLYELLTGAPAQRVEGEGIEALRAVLERDPPRPSAVAPAGRQRAIAGDLDNIVMKALAKEVPRRYASVEALSDDLGRHLDGLPVLARAGTWTYRVGKLVRRSRGIIAAVGVVVASLSAATVISVRQARRADEAAQKAKKRFDEVRTLASSLLFEVDGKIEKLEGSTEARELIVKRALEYLDGLAADAGDDPGLLRELAAAYVKIGEVQGSTWDPSLGRPRDGLESLAKARRILDGLVAARRDDGPTRWLVVRLLVSTADLHRAVGEQESARARGREAMELVRALPEDRAYDYRLALRASMFVFTIAKEDNDAALASRHAAAGLDVATRWLRTAPPPDARYWFGLAREMAGGAHLLGGDPDAAASDYRDSAETFAALSAAEPENAPYRREVWYARVQLAMCLSGRGDAKIWQPAVGDRASAERALVEALPLAELHARRDPRDERAALELLYTHDAIAAEIAERDPAAALPHAERARAVFAGLPKQTRDAAFARQFEGLGRCAMALPLAKLGRRAEALAAIETGLSLAEIGAAGGATLEERANPWMCRFDAARARRALGDGEAAAALLDGTAAPLRSVIATRPPTLMPYIGLVETLEMLAALQPARRCPLLDEAAAAWRSWPGTPTPYTERRRAEIEAARAGCR
jgi:hypothetical protein